MGEEITSDGQPSPKLLDEVKRLSSQLLDASNEVNALREYAFQLGHSLKKLSYDENPLENNNAESDLHHEKSPASLESNSNESKVEEENNEAENSEFITEVKARASTEGWLIKLSEIELGEAIGHGSTADVYRGVWHGLDVAVKCMKPEFFKSDKSGKKSFTREISILARLRHPYILRLFGVSLDPPQNYRMVTEILSDRTVMEWLHGSKKRQWVRTIPLPPLHLRIRVLLQLALALQYLHEQRPIIIHRDIKPSNVFLDSSENVRLADFGFARYVPPVDEVLTGETGTYMYMSPEVIKHERYSEKCDVYSFGIMMNEVASGNPPFIEEYLTPFQIAWSVAKGELRPKLTSILENRGLPNLISACWAQDPTSRPTFAYITSVLKPMYDHVLSSESDAAASRPMPGFLGMVQNLGKMF